MLSNAGLHARTSSRTGRDARDFAAPATRTRAAESRMKTGVSAFEACL
ncbi:hypothetical protein BURMUCGD1_2909 [Burkholderia multivorans CGD1]|nr:hypothetical protein BURMUCGD1_2909 [Burkholderia multivorans CGD1]